MANVLLEVKQQSVESSDFFLNKDEQEEVRLSSNCLGLERKTNMIIRVLNLLLLQLYCDKPVTNDVAPKKRKSPKDAEPASFPIKTF